MVSSDEEDIITVVTDDRVTASVLHADSDVSVDQDEHIVTPLCSPSKKNNSKQPADKNIVTVEDVASVVSSTGVSQARSDGSNKKLVRFQDSSHDHDAKPLQSNSTSVALNKVSIYSVLVFMYVYTTHICIVGIG